MQRNWILTKEQRKKKKKKTHSAWTNGQYFTDNTFRCHISQMAFSNATCCRLHLLMHFPKSRVQGYRSDNGVTEELYISISWMNHEVSGCLLWVFCRKKMIVFWDVWLCVLITILNLMELSCNFLWLILKTVYDLIDVVLWVGVVLSLLWLPGWFYCILDLVMAALLLKPAPVLTCLSRGILGTS